MKSVTSAVGRLFLVYRHSEKLYFAERIASVAVIYFALEIGFKASCKLIMFEKLYISMYFKTNSL